MNNDHTLVHCVDSVKQFKAKNIETAKTSKWTKYLKAAISVAAVAMTVIAFIAAAATPVGWIIGGCALLATIGVAGYKSFQKLENQSMVEGLKQSQGAVDTKIGELETEKTKDKIIESLQEQMQKLQDKMTRLELLN